MTESRFTRLPPGISRWILSAVLILASVTAVPMVYANGQLPVARIVIVESPAKVSPGQNFTVRVSVDYSASYSTDIAILDADTGFVLASKGLIIPAGRNLFTFSLAGRDRTGAWPLLASVRVWWHGGWYANQNGGTFPFEIKVSDNNAATLKVASNLTPALVTVDGITYSISSGGVELSTNRGLHTIEVEPLLRLGDDARAVFDHWSDGVGSSSREVYLADKLDLSAIYVAEFYLSVQSNIGETVGSGWYPAGMNATFAALHPSEVTRSPLGIVTGYKFSHWSGDSESTSFVSWVAMDRPKTVTANWVNDSSQATAASQLVIISLVLLSCSLMLVAVALRRRGRAKSRHAILGRREILSGPLMLLVLLTALAYSPMVQPAQALTLIQPQSITIGDAVWYQWRAAETDTCLVWLGGGIVGQSSFMINPLEYESYNTVRFIQDLAEYYDVLALKKGSMRTVHTTLNKTVYAEPYPGSDNFIEKIRIWANEQGYAYLYMVGYSVGAMVAAQELILANPNKWTSPNGLIIITTKIAPGTLSRAGSLRASLLLLYGDKIAQEFTASGERLYQNAPDEGWRDGYWYHKEYHVIPDVEHEVWTIRDSGEYDGRATLLTVKFIERSKSLQFERIRSNLVEVALNRTVSNGARASSKVAILSMKSPGKVGTGEVFRVFATTRYEVDGAVEAAVLAFDIDTATVLSAAERKLAGGGEAEFVTNVFSGEEHRSLRLSFIPLVLTENGWSVAANETNDVTVEVTDSVALTVMMTYPNVPVEVDGEQLYTETSGQVTVNLTPGEHVVTVPSVIMLGNTSRAVFQEWNSTASSPSLRLTPSNDMALFAIYRRQYYLSVTSQFGQITGTGWYDEASTALFHVTPVLAPGQTLHAFAGWSGDSEDTSPASTVFMDSPKNVRASWTDVKHLEGNKAPILFELLLMLSSVFLLASLTFAVISFRAARRTLAQNMSPPSP